MTMFLGFLLDYYLENGLFEPMEDMGALLFLYHLLCSLDQCEVKVSRGLLLGDSIFSLLLTLMMKILEVGL